MRIKKLQQLFFFCIMFPVFASLFAQEANKDNIKIFGRWNSASDSTKLDITYWPLEGRPTFDSSVVKNGVFRAEMKSNDPVIITLNKKLSVNDQRQGAAWDFYSTLLIPGETKFEVNEDLKNAKLSGVGSVNDSDYQEFNKLSNSYVELGNELVSTVYSNDNLTEEEKNNRGKEIRDSLNLIRDKELYLKTIKEKPNSLIALVALFKYAGEPVWRPRKKIEPERIETLLNSLSDSLTSYPIVNELRRELKISKSTGIGKPMIDFTLKDTSGKNVSLSDFKGNYIFLDFWASWCAPCRREHPNLKQQFLKYKDENFVIVSVSLDTEEARKAWLAAIEKDGVGLWPHLKDDGGFKGDVANDYYVRSIPTNFLIGPDGKFLDRNLYREELNKKLDDIFNKKQRN